MKQHIIFGKSYVETTFENATHIYPKENCGLGNGHHMFKEVKAISGQKLTQSGRGFNALRRESGTNKYSFGGGFTYDFYLFLVEGDPMPITREDIEKQLTF